jgi:hypothetical protein
VRREMLTKRMDLTVESFLWSQKAAADEDRIRAAVAAQRQHLAAPPAKYEVRERLC